MAVSLDRQQARQVEAQVAFPMVAELDGFQGFQRWAGAAGEARMAEFGQALAQFGAAQLAAEQVACLAVGQQDLPAGRRSGSPPAGLPGRRP
ncbi:hypothetical protein P4050_07505 [Pseudomonas aeruginosa]|nr:hypothetical protein [Pseudomonas aeruginosa]